ncbi:MAG: leucine-rich repeat protein [Desulfosporosinus sp.]|nr:leucine-rich repeat protein [Desulfosporosinus sp.]
MGDSAFFGCTRLNRISIRPGVVSISREAFGRCEDLTSITITSAATTIEDNSDTIPAATTIRGYAPSTAQDYAEKYTRTFEVLRN